MIYPHMTYAVAVWCFKLNKKKTYNEIAKKISKTHPYASECYI